MPAASWRADHLADERNLPVRPFSWLGWIEGVPPATET